MREIHQRSYGTYGAPRIHAELAAEGTQVSRKRVARVMREAGLAGVSRRKGPRTTHRDPQARPAPDLVERRFNADGPNRLWVADITYVPTASISPWCSTSQTERGGGTDMTHTTEGESVRIGSTRDPRDMPAATVGSLFVGRPITDETAETIGRLVLELAEVRTKLASIEDDLHREIFRGDERTARAFVLPTHVKYWPELHGR